MLSFVFEVPSFFYFPVRAKFYYRWEVPYPFGLSLLQEATRIPTAIAIAVFYQTQSQLGGIDIGKHVFRLWFFYIQLLQYLSGFLTGEL